MTALLFAAPAASVEKLVQDGRQPVTGIADLVFDQRQGLVQEVLSQPLVGLGPLELHFAGHGAVVQPVARRAGHDR